ncbi:hypothetical protein LDENG_00296720 [Lucifuga dentata]|nr:hypothetical protein LDENG_00296720 [Lucifuga dentata]
MQSPTSLMSCPRSFQQVRHASKMLTNTLTEDELVSKKGNVTSSFESCSVLRFRLRSSYKLYRTPLLHASRRAAKGSAGGIL